MKQKKVLEQSLCGVLALLGFAACAETSVEYGCSFEQTESADY